MGIARKVGSRVLRWIKSEISSEYKRCESLNSSNNRCIKQHNHLFCHEDAWRKLWW